MKAVPLMLLLLAGCATNVELWPPKVAVAVGDAYAGHAEDCTDEVDCSLARGGHLSEQGRKLVAGTLNTIHLLIPGPVPATVAPAEAPE